MTKRVHSLDLVIRVSNRKHEAPEQDTLELGRRGHILCFVCKEYREESQIQVIHKRMVRFQKLTRNFSPYTDATYTVSSGNCPSFSCATSSSLLMLTAGPVSKMASQQEDTFCVLRFEVSRSVITVQRALQLYCCTIITDLDTSKRSTQKASSCCDTILETGPAAPQ